MAFAFMLSINKFVHMFSLIDFSGRCPLYGCGRRSCCQSKGFERGGCRRISELDTHIVEYSSDKVGPVN